MKVLLLLFIGILALTSVAADAQELTIQVRNPAFPEGCGPRVVWDAAHHNEHHWWMTPFQDVLKKDGFRLRFQNERWTPQALDSADIVVIPGPLAVSRDSLLAKGVDHYWWSDEGRQSAFTPKEVMALVKWVRLGGSLLLILDHAPSPDAARMLTEALGVEVRNSMTWDGKRRPPDYSNTDNQRASKILFSREYASLGEHAILQGRDKSERVDRVVTYVGSSLVGPLGSSPLLLLSQEAFDYWRVPPERGGGEHRIPASGRSQAVAFSLDAGRVVVVAEYTLFQASWGGSGDPEGKIGAGMAYAGAQAQQFVTNIARWLAKVIP